MSNAGVFTKVFDPYLGKYTRWLHLVNANRFGWIEVKAELQGRFIEDAINGKQVIGFFNKNFTKVVGVDIDDHKGRTSTYLRRLYAQVCLHLGNPLLLAKSPRGLHAFWILSEPIPWLILFSGIKQQLNGLEVEVLPSHKHALRIPAKHDLLNPETLQSIQQPFSDVLSKIEPVHSSSVLPWEYSPDEIIKGLRNDSGNIESLTKKVPLKILEEALLPFQNNNTNNAFVKLIVACRNTGCDEEEAVAHFRVWLSRSPEYNGNLRDEREYRRRIGSIYKRKFVPQQPKLQQQDLFNEDIARVVTDRIQSSNQRKNPIRMFVLTILGWKDWHDAIVQDPAFVAVFDWIYPWYRKNRLAGFYPLPSRVLKQGNARYYQLLPKLIEIGFLEVSSFSYSPKAHICKYYRICPEKFISDDVRNSIDTALH